VKFGGGGISIVSGIGILVIAEVVDINNSDAG